MSIVLNAVLLIPSVSAVASVDVTCLQKAVTERTKNLKAAYDTFAKDITTANDMLQKGETDQLQYADYSFRQNEIARTFSNYSYEVSERSRDLSGRITDAWNLYQKSRNVCNVSAQQDSLSSVPYPPNYAIPSISGYPYGSYGSYGGGYNAYDPYRFYDPYRSYDPYSNRYPYHGAATCSQRPLAPPPPGCGYQYGTDSYGCPSYTPVCSNTQSSSSPCTCSNLYAPVCSRDGRTYFNACYALCLGGDVKYQGPCQY